MEAGKPPPMVTHPSTNRARRSATIKTNTLPLSHSTKKQTKFKKSAYIFRYNKLAVSMFCFAEILQLSNNKNSSNHYSKHSSQNKTLNAIDKVCRQYF